MTSHRSLSGSHESCSGETSADAFRRSLIHSTGLRLIGRFDTFANVFHIFSSGVFVFIFGEIEAVHDQNDGTVSIISSSLSTHNGDAGRCFRKADIALIGLAVMGQNLILNMDSKGFVVCAFNRTVDKVSSFANQRYRGS